MAIVGAGIEVVDSVHVGQSHGVGCMSGHATNQPGKTSCMSGHAGGLTWCEVIH